MESRDEFLARRWAGFSEEERGVRLLLAGAVHGKEAAQVMATRKYADRDLHITGLYNTNCYGFSIAHDGVIPHGFLVVQWAYGRVLNVVLFFKAQSKSLTPEFSKDRGEAIGVITRYLRRLGIPGEEAFAE